MLNFLLFLFISISYGQNTNFLWIQEKSGVLDSGNCYEVDKNIDLESYVGKEIFQYVKQVPRKFCLPKDNTTFFFSTVSGRCFEGDTKTSGKNYFSYQNVSKCKPDSIKYKTMNKIGTSKCYEVDSETGGQKYYRAVKGQFCLTKDTRYTWIPNGDKVGRCYSVDKVSGQKLLVDKKICRPESLAYYFVRTGPFKGHCLEKSTEQSNDYSLKTKTENCKTVETSFFFYKKPGEMSGFCYELDIATNGNNYLDKVDSKFCK